jgi:hypothetical protein
MQKTVIPEHYAAVLAYLSAWAPLGTTFEIDLAVMAQDLGYTSRTNVYCIIKHLRRLGAVKHVVGRRGYTAFICYAREEQFEVKPQQRGGEKLSVRNKRLGITDEPSKRRGRPPRVGPRIKKKKLISYAGKERGDEDSWEF